MIDAEKILGGKSIEERDTEQDVDGIEDAASIAYDMSSLLNSIGTNDFKTEYISTIGDIKRQKHEYQKNLCHDILKKVEEEYNFIFPHTIPLDDQKELNDLYDFVCFLEFDYLDFISRVWGYLGTDLRNTNIDEFCKSNDKKIVSQVDELVDLTDFNEPISIFIRTYNKINLVEFVMKRTKNDKMLIVLKLMEGEIRNA